MLAECDMISLSLEWEWSVPVFVACEEFVWWFEEGRRYQKTFQEDCFVAKKKGKERDFTPSTPGCLCHLDEGAPAGQQAAS